MFIQFLLYPPAARRFGVLNCLKAVTMTFPVVYVLTPFTALLPNQSAQQIGMFAIMLMKCWAVIFAFPCSTILLTNSASSLRILGTLNGVSTSVSALGRAAGPAIGGLTFSYGVVKGYVILPWWTLAFFAVLGRLTFLSTYYPLSNVLKSLETCLARAFARNICLVAPSTSFNRKY